MLLQTRHQLRRRNTAQTRIFTFQTDPMQRQQKPPRRRATPEPISEVLTSRGARFRRGGFLVPGLNLLARLTESFAQGHVRLGIFWHAV